MSFGIPAALLFGLILIIASLGLFLTSKFKPDLYQESDNIYAVIGIICGLLLLISLDLGAAMAFQQLLMIGALISIMWQFMQVRAENKRLKGGGRSASATRDREAVPARRPYAASLDDEPEYPAATRGGRRFGAERLDRQFQPSSYEEDFVVPEQRTGRMLPEYDRPERREAVDRQRGDYAAPSPSYESRDYSRPIAQPESDWSDTPRTNGGSDWDQPGRARRRSGAGNEAGGRDGRGRRRSSLMDSGDEPAAKSSAYVEYEPVDPEEPAQFPPR